MAPRTLFEKFGHHCEIYKGERELTNFQGSSIFRRWFNRLRMINETNQRSYSFLRSQKKIENEHKRMHGYPWIIHPFSDFKKYWEIFISVIMAFQFITIPLDVAFYNAHFSDNFVRRNTFQNMRIATDVLSFVNIIVTFFCGYADEKQTIVILSPKEIAMKYLSSTFILDLISSIPTDVILNRYHIVGQSEAKKTAFFACHYLGLIKMLRYPIFVKYTASMFGFEMNEVYYVIHRLSIAIITFLLYLHVICCCCISWIISQLSYNYNMKNSHAIIKIYGTDSDTMFNLYSQFFYSGCLMVLNAGYGFTCYTKASMFFTTNVWICSRILYILTIAYFIQLHTAINSSSQKYIDMLCEVKDYMRHRQIPNFLQKRILSYYDIKFQNYYFKESEILNTVSGQLRQEILMNTCRKLVEDVSFFNNLPLSLLIRIVSSLSYDIFLTNDVITKVGTIGDSMFFIYNGTVAVYSQSGKEMCHLQDGDHFGEIALITKDSTRIASVIAAEVCEVYRLDRIDFIKAILPFPDLYEKIAFIASERKENTQVAEEVPKYRETTHREEQPPMSVTRSKIISKISRSTTRGSLDKEKNQSPGLIHASAKQ